MTSIDFELLLKGIQLLLGTQLILVGGVHLTRRSNGQNKFLALLCLIHGLWFFKHVFTGYWESNLFLFLLIGPGKPIFVGSILFFYFKMISGDLERKQVFVHLLAPTIYYGVLVITRFPFGDQIATNLDLELSLLFSVAVLLIFWYYFFITKNLIRHPVKNILIPKAYKKTLFLFYSLYFFLLQIPIWDILSNILQTDLITGQTYVIINSLYESLFKYIGFYASYSYIHILGYVLFLYALSEWPVLKKIFLPKETSIHQSVIAHKDLLDQKVHQYFQVNKRFKDPEMSLTTCSHDLNLSREELIDYFIVSGKGMFKDYVNKLRTEEFKKLILNDLHQKYDLVGIATECGFNSKSTFFRAFKDIEGSTPKEYYKKHKN